MINITRDILLACISLEVAGLLNLLLNNLIAAENPIQTKIMPTRELKEIKKLTIIEFPY
jgi:hypothetical protein